MLLFFEKDQKKHLKEHQQAHRDQIPVKYVSKRPSLWLNPCAQTTAEM